VIGRKPIEDVIVANRGKGTAKDLEARPARIKGRRLKPIRKVTRELESPDGTTLQVEVPVYPPFQLEDRPSRKETEKGE